MIIKKWDSGTSQWVAQSPKVTFSDIVDNVGAETPVSIFSSGKLREDYLPNSVYGGMKFVGSFSAGTPSGPLALSTFITGTTTSGYNITSTLDAFTGLTWSADYDGIGQRYIGYYWVCVNGVQVDDKTSTAQADWQTSPAVLDDGVAPFDSGGGVVVQGVTLEPGDWLIITGYDNTNKTFVFSVINNTYSTATTTTFGVVKLGYTTNAKNYKIQTTNDGLYVNVPWTDTDTVYTLPAATATVRGGIELFSNTEQSVAANAVTATASRTYGVQVNSDGQAVVNVPWSDTNTTYSEATSSTLGLVKIGYTQIGQNYPVELALGKMYVNVPWTDTDTTYSAGVGISLSGTEIKMAQPIRIGTTTPATSFQIADALWFDTN